MTRLARDLHPVAWWVWAIGLSIAASLTTNPVILLTVVGCAVTVVWRRRSDQPWARAFRLYCWLAVAVVVIRVLFRILLGGSHGSHLWWDLPQLRLWPTDLILLGPVTGESLLFSLYDGMRLAALLLCIGAANALANPKRLLKSLPPALYEIGTALVVAVTAIPQLADSVRRVRAAQALRPGPRGRVGRLRRFLVPVLEDALERSLALAAGMDARGYGRTGDLTARQRLVTGALMLAGLLGVCLGVYAVLDGTVPGVVAHPLLLGGVAVALIGLTHAGRTVTRTRYRPDRWRTPELLVAGSGLMVGVTGVLLARLDVVVAHPAPMSWPGVPGPVLVALLIGVLPAVLAPPATRAETRAPVEVAA
ncbi:energy-coupling factor transporter transmembrane component T [Nocardioides limicola]|uniref:energy-coupling factor transporter transmembrane component T n=1 Tax=Nocardioides limicola TaxID=2803368 RepID=UPI0027DC3879|nr:energy-coupling factor transporter transmembrane component T [Nocardioides sp. DJM-14]